MQRRFIDTNRIFNPLIEGNLDAKKREIYS
jgi:hypothetical protein